MASADTVQLPQELVDITNLLDERAEALATGDSAIQAAALRATKFVFDLALQSEREARLHIDALISSWTPDEAPQTRSQTRATGKRKRTPSPEGRPKVTFTPTPLSTLFTDSLEPDQIWAQVDLRTKNICDLLELALEGGPEGQLGDEDEDQDSKLQLIMQALENGEDVDLEGLDMEGMSLDEEDEEESDESEDSEDAEEEEEEDDGEELGEQVAELRDPSSDEDDDDDAPPSLMDLMRPKAAKRPKFKARSQLDDGFFDLASFNAETEAAESKKVSRGRLSANEDEGSDSDMSVDLFAPVDDTETFDEEDLEAETGEVFYRDFFEPPPRASSKKAKSKPPPSPEKKPGTVRFHEEVRVKKIKPKGKNLPLSTMYDEDDEDDEADEDAFMDGIDDMGGESGSEDEEEIDGLEEEDEDDEDDEDAEDAEDANSSDEGDDRMAIERLKDDLFADDDDVSPQADRSVHEQRMAALREQIAALETENVSKKDWVLMGEATSRTRPQNSLLEEDLEFERLMKAVPVVTEEKVQALEDRIKARILEGRFDDVVRLRPVDDKPFLPSRFFELQDTKSKQSLAQIYEDEYVTATGGDGGDDRDGKLKKEHEEIDQLWDNICSKLDALCNAHFVPKQPKAVISTIANVSTATLESALPTAKSASTMLAPEEIFTPSAGDLRARSELTPEEKRAQRSKTRKAKQKSRQVLDKSADNYSKLKSVKQQKQAALESVVKSGKGVTVVGKKNKEVLGKKSRSTGSAS
ncbi:hypothetical protein HGRIS_007871 [Hohenbuehelia grisea]|uniref:U3 small nucleolar ribonucleoprotein protein MPP10 n=1 Tax=Hohenbuehelia grisea TaxID=104357 RepID=A0ABR3J669_9AGAR